MFIPVHAALAAGLTGTVLWYTKDANDKKPCILSTIAVNIWLVTITHRWFNLYWRPIIGKIARKLEDLDATTIELALSRSIRVLPGSYFYSFFPTNHGYGLVGHPSVVAWHPPDELNPSQHLPTVTFLLSRHSSFATEIDKITEGDTIVLTFVRLAIFSI